MSNQHEQNEADVQAVIRDYIVREILNGQDRGLDESSPLLEWGILESLSMVSLVSFLEQRFGVKLDTPDYMPDNFTDLRAISRLVMRNSAPARN